MSTNTDTQDDYLQAFADTLAKGKETVAFRFHKPYYQYTACHVDFSIVYVDPTRQCNMGFYNNQYDDCKNKFQHLLITAQMDTSFPAPYAFRIVLDGERLGNCTLDTLETHYKALKSIHTKLAKLEETEGYVRDHMDFLLRLARVLKVSAYFHCFTRNETEVLCPDMKHFSDTVGHYIDANLKLMGIEKTPA